MRAFLFSYFMEEKADGELGFSEFFKEKSE
jgi:hypothetical protein